MVPAFALNRRRARSILRRMEWTPSETRTADAPLLVPNQMVHELRVPLDEDDDFGNESVSVPTGTWMSRCSDDESCCVTLLDADSAARSYERKQGCCGLEWAFCRHRAHFSVVLPIGPTNSTPRGDIYRRARPRSVRGASSHSRLPQPDLSRNGVVRSRRLRRTFRLRLLHNSAGADGRTGQPNYRTDGRADGLRRWPVGRRGRLFGRRL